MCAIYHLEKRVISFLLGFYENAVLCHTIQHFHKCGLDILYDIHTLPKKLYSSHVHHRGSCPSKTDSGVDAFALVDTEAIIISESVTAAENTETTLLPIKTGVR